MQFSLAAVMPTLRELTPEAAQPAVAATNTAPAEHPFAALLNQNLQGLNDQLSSNLENTAGQGAAHPLNQPAAQSASSAQGEAAFAALLQGQNLPAQTPDLPALAASTSPAETAPAATLEAAERALANMPWESSPSSSAGVGERLDTLPPALALPELMVSATTPLRRSADLTSGPDANNPGSARQFTPPPGLLTLKEIASNSYQGLDSGLKTRAELAVRDAGQLMAGLDTTMAQRSSISGALAQTLLGNGDKSVFTQASNESAGELKPGAAVLGLADAMRVGQDAARQPGVNLEVAAPLNKSSWGQEMSNRILWMVRHDQQSAQIRINPPQLGPVEVRISMHNETTQVHFFTPHAAVREALEAALPRLRELMGENGLQLSQADVSDSRNPNQQTSQGQSRFGQAAQSQLGHLASSRDGVADSTTEATVISVADGLIDYFA